MGYSKEVRPNDKPKDSDTKVDNEKDVKLGETIKKEEE